MSAPVTPPQRLGSLPEGCDVDAILTLSQMACWLQLDPETLRRRCKAGGFPSFLEGSEYRFHPRSYLAARGQITTRWEAALVIWNKLTAGVISDSEVKRSYHREFSREFDWFKTRGASLPA